MDLLALSSIITGLISGIVSSAIFFFILSYMQPKISIAESICKDIDPLGEYYGFKILNQSKFNALDLKIEILLKTPFNSKGGLNHTIEWIPLKKDHFLQFPRYKKSDKHADYAIIVATRDDIEARWKDQAQFLEVKVHCKHSFSGISKSFSQKFYTKRSCIKPGIFNFGKTFDIS